MNKSCCFFLLTLNIVFFITFVVSLLIKLLNGNTHLIIMKTQQNLNVLKVDVTLFFIFLTWICFHYSEVFIGE